MKRIKKLLLPILAVMVFAGCEKENKNTQDVNQVLYDNGMEIVSSMAEQAGCKEYVSLYSTEESVVEKVQEVSACDYSKAKTVYKLTITQEDMKTVVSAYEQDLGDEIPESLRKDLGEKLMNAISSILNSQGGASALAASSVIRADECFVCEGITETTLCIFTFEDAYPIMVTYNPGKDGAVYAVGTVLLNEEYKTLEEKDIKDLLSIMYLTEYDLEIIE